MSPTKTDEPIDMLFGLCCPRNPVLGWGPNSPRERDSVGGHVPPCCEVYGENTFSCRETADLIDMPFGLCT